MSIARENSSKVVDGGKGHRKGKGKGGKKGNSKPGYISWRVDWHFGESNQVLTERSLPEHEVVGQVLEKFLNNSLPRGPTKHLLAPYAEIGADKLEVFLHQPPRTNENLAKFSEKESSEPESEVESPAKESPVRPPLPPPPPPPAPALPHSLLSAPWRRPALEDIDESESEEESEEKDEKDEAEQKAEIDPCIEYIPYIRLDKSRTLRENLMDRAIVEYPVLHVALPQELNRFIEAGGAG